MQRGSDSGLQTLKHASACAIFLLLCATLLQKFSVPGFSGLLSLSLVALLAVTAWCAIWGVLVLDTQAALAYLAFVSISALVIILAPSSHLSLPSWGLLCLVQLPLMFRFSGGGISQARLLSIVSTLGTVLAFAGVLQLAVQAVLGPRVAFFIDYNLPEAIALKGYNALNLINWDGAYFKSTGFVFAEPSFFSQFLAIAMLAEFLLGGRLTRMVIIGAGLLSSYSGTGLMTLLLFGAFYLPAERRLQVLGGTALFVVIVVSLSDVLHLDAVTSRVSELTEPGSSGYARFVSIFSLIDRVILADPLTFLFGRGPGSVTEFFQSGAFDLFDPTWGKMFYEYGALGSVAYAIFFYVAILRHRAPLAAPMAFTYFLLGGYLVDAVVMTQLAVLGAWAAAAPAQSTTETAAGFVAASAKA